MHAALCLVLTFFSVACIWLLAGAEFLGVALVLVYVGAVMVLFLFVVMMLDIDVAPLREGFVRYLPVGLRGGGGDAGRDAGADRRQGAAGHAAGRRCGRRGAACPTPPGSARALFTDFLLPFEVAAVILTVAVIAAVMLTLRRRTGTKHQDPARQVAGARASDRLRMVKMEAEHPVPRRPVKRPRRHAMRC